MKTQHLPTTTRARKAIEHGQQVATRNSTQILIVEDEPLTAEVFTLSLQRAGYNVRVAKDGLQALRLLREHPPHLLILDMSIPTVSGAEVLRQLRSSDLHDAPVIVVSGCEQRHTSVTKEELSPGIWLTKPIKPLKLAAIVSTVLNDDII
jgi:DNA-binding response OmpR family regulator